MYPTPEARALAKELRVVLLSFVCREQRRIATQLREDYLEGRISGDKFRAELKRIYLG